MGRSIKNCLFRREISSHGFQLDFFLPRGLTETSERKAFTSLKQWVPKPIHLPGSNLETLPASSDNKARQHPMSWRLAPDSNILSFVEKFRLWNQFRGQILTSYVSSTFCVWRGYRPPPHGGAVKGHREGNWHAVADTWEPSLQVNSYQQRANPQRWSLEGQWKGHLPSQRRAAYQDRRRKTSSLLRF